MASIHFETAEAEQGSSAKPMNVPKPALYMAAGMVAVVLALAGSARLFGFGAFKETPSTVLVERQLRFEDAADGGIRVIDARTNRQATLLPSGTNGFLRGALRALTRERRMARLGATQPFRLIRYADGRLVLLDPATAQHVTITSFGPTQIASFDALLTQ
jgi:putative photosynthetic complex assembly protein